MNKAMSKALAAFSTRVEFRKLPLAEQNRLTEIVNAEFMKWYVSAAWKE